MSTFVLVFVGYFAISTSTVITANIPINLQIDFWSKDKCEMAKSVIVQDFAKENPNSKFIAYCFERGFK